MTAKLKKPAPRNHRRRAFLLLAATVLAFAIEAGQLVRLGVQGSTAIRSDPVATVSRNTARPDITDRNGRLLATDVAMPSVFVDPRRVLDKDEVAEKLAGVLPGINERQLLADLSDKNRRFVWVKRGLSPADAQRVHDLGLPGVSFRDEPRRVYPAGEDGGHVIGFVDVENHGAAGIERYLDAQGLTDLTDGAARSEREPVALSIDIAVQHTLRSELERAIKDFGAGAAAGLVLDLQSGEVLAAVSLPDFAAGNAALSLDANRMDRITGGTYELGSVFKTITLAMAKDAGVLAAGKLFDATQALQVGKSTIDDFHPTRRQLTAEEVFLHSSNIGVSLMALEVGEVKMRGFLDRLGLTGPMMTELGKVAAPQLPPRWGKTTTMTVSFGHGIAVAPLQFAAAAAGLVTGRQVQPTFLKRDASDVAAPKALVTAKTRDFLGTLMQHNVTSAEGTGKRAAVAGYDVGGKTGTADIPGKGGYGRQGVLSSFLAAWPMSRPRYLSYVMLWAPQATEASGNQTAAGATAAPVTARLIARISPQLGLAPSPTDGM
jgi:cell division protein FtsI (penicillin-binding protein 3)